MTPQLNNTYSLLQIHSYWARLESIIGKDITAARGVWESMLKNRLTVCCFHLQTCNIVIVFHSMIMMFLGTSYLYSGSMLEAWQSYISMETEMGHINEARSLYKRCYTKRFSGTGSEVNLLLCYVALFVIFIMWVFSSLLYLTSLIIRDPI